MRKLINGIVDFRKNALPAYQHELERLARGQSPDALLIACCDSRVAPNTFASTNPGDLCVVRNVGNLVSPCNSHDHTATDESTAAAIEFTMNSLRVKDIIICGHSECAAINAIIDGREKIDSKYLQAWLRYGEPSYEKYKNGFRVSSPLPLSMNNEVSKINVLQQLEHLKTYNIVNDHIKNGTLRIHGWWFDIASGGVYYYDHKKGEFVLIDEYSADKI